MRCDSNGHTIEAVDFGHNKFEEKKNKVMNFLGFMWKPVLQFMEAATIMVITWANGQCKFNWKDIVGIITLSYQFHIRKKC